MGTRSHIARLNNDGTVTGIYCHWDGYPSNNGCILNEHYNSPRKIARLLAQGDLSSLGRNIGRKHDFDLTPPGVCNFYGRDRGETMIDAVTHASLAEAEEFVRDSDREWFYLFRNGRWEVTAFAWNRETGTSGQAWWIPVADLNPEATTPCDDISRPDSAMGYWDLRKAALRTASRVSARKQAETDRLKGRRRLVLA